MIFWGKASFKSTIGPGELPSPPQKKKEALLNEGSNGISPSLLRNTLEIQVQRVYFQAGVYGNQREP